MARSICQFVAAAIVAAGAVTTTAAEPVKPADADRWVREADALAKAGEYERAITTYKRADQLKPRAALACSIGLAYVRRKAWAQAQLALASCRQRATDSDRSPPWLDKAQRELDTQIEAAKVPAVAFRVGPELPTPLLTMVGWPTDESFAPRTLHLPIGRYAVDATSPGGRSVRTEFEVTGPLQTVDIDLSSLARPVVESATAGARSAVPSGTGPAASRAERKPPSRVLEYSLLGGGGFAVAVGAVSHVLAARDRARMEKSAEAWEAHRSAFGRERAIAIGGYAVGTALLAMGTYRLFRTSDNERAVTISPVLSERQVGLALQWSR